MPGYGGEEGRSGTPAIVGLPAGGNYPPQTARPDLAWPAGQAI
jgi:hypothetical protein